MPFIDLPPQLQERVICSIAAAVKYEVPANIMLAVQEIENGKPGQWVKNRNGTHDVGPMQFNTAYLADLARYKITARDVAQAGCYSFDLAAWRIHNHLRHDRGDLWTRAANYHSRTPQFNLVYRVKLVQKAAKWANWLEARFVTYDMMTSGAASLRPAAAAATTKATAAAVQVTASPMPWRPSVTWNTAGYVPRKLLINGQ